jgi:hypothetical protein
MFLEQTKYKNKERVALKILKNFLNDWSSREKMKITARETC